MPLRFFVMEVFTRFQMGGRFSGARSGSMKVRFHFSSPLLWLFPRWVSGVTLGCHIFFRRTPSHVHPCTIQHELIHVCQYAQHGFGGFLWRYLWRERHLPYRRKSLEEEAFAHQDDPGYRERRWPDLHLELPPWRSEE